MQIKLGTKNTGARFPITRSTDRHGTWEQQKKEKKRRFQNIWKLALQNRANNNQKWTISRYTKKVQIKHLIKSRNSKYLTNESRPFYTKAFGIRSREKKWEKLWFQKLRNYTTFPKEVKDCVYIYIYPSIYLSIYLYIYIYPSTYTYIYIYLYIYINIYYTVIFTYVAPENQESTERNNSRISRLYLPKKHIEEQLNSQTWGKTQGPWARDKIKKKKLQKSIVPESLDGIPKK